MVAALISVLVLKGGISFEQVKIAASRFSMATLLLITCCAIAQFLFAMLRIFVLFPSGMSLPFLKVARAISLGQTLNMFFPARAGDVVKAMIVSEGGKGKVGLMASAGIIIADKVADTLALVALILLSGAFLVPGMKWSIHPPAWAWLLIPFLVVALALAWGLGLRDRVASLHWLTNLRGGLSVLGSPRRVSLALLLGIGSWTFEVFSLYFLCTAQGAALGFRDLVFVLVVLNLAISVPVSLANLGPFEAAIVFALGTFGIATPEALAIGTVHHFGQVVGVTLWAALTGWGRGPLPSAPARETASHSAGGRAGSSSEFHVELRDKMRAIEHYEKASVDYDAAVSRGPLRYFRERERCAMLRLAALDGPGWAIDVGCGAGYYALAAKHRGMKVHAVDASTGMVMRLSGRVDETEVADVETLEVERLYERVICAGVLDFVLSPERAMRNLCRLVKPGGRLVLLLPRKGAGGLWYRFEKWLIGVRVNLYTRSWLEGLAHEEGLRLVEAVHPLPTNMALAFERAGS